MHILCNVSIACFFISAPENDRFPTSERIHHITDTLGIAPPLLIRALQVSPQPELGRLDLIPDLDQKLDLVAVRVTEARVEPGIRGLEAEADLLENIWVWVQAQNLKAEFKLYYSADNIIL